MRKFLFIVGGILGGLYFLLHLVLGSSPVQKKVIEEIRQALGLYGIIFTVESIEFSTFTPKIYLNRVTLSSAPNAEISLSIPITIDKIKLHFEPLRLIQKQISIKEAVLFNPKVLLPDAGKIYRRATQVFRSKEPVQLEGEGFTVVLKRLGIVDALFNVVSKDPDFSIRSQSLTAFLENQSGSERTLSVESRDLEVVRYGRPLLMQNVDVNVDVTDESLRLNRAIVEGEDYSINIQGTTSFPIDLKRRQWPEAISASYQISLPMALLEHFPEIQPPKATGRFSTSGTLQILKGRYEGSGVIAYEKLVYDNYKLGSGRASYFLHSKEAVFSDIRLDYGGGEIRSDRLTLQLGGPSKLTGEIQLVGIQFASVLDAVKSPDALVNATIDSRASVDGQLANEFKIQLDLKDLRVSQFLVVDELPLVKKDTNTVVSIAEGKGSAKLTFFENRLELQSDLKVLGGALSAKGTVGFDNNVHIEGSGKALSLTQLKTIGTLELGGDLDFHANVTVGAQGANVSGSISILDTEIGDVVFGTANAKVQYQDSLLTFEEIRIPSALEPVTGAGFVDFAKNSHYRFDLQARRLPTDRVFDIFRKNPLKFSVPTQGDVTSRVRIEGGHDSRGIEVRVSGEARKFRWYEESWNSAQYVLSYRPGETEVTKLLLAKNSGALDVRASISERESELKFVSAGLKLEDLDHLGKAPLTGVIEGEIGLEGDLSRPRLKGAFTLSSVAFRGNALGDSAVTLSTQGNTVEILGSVAGEKLKGRWERSGREQDRWELLLYFKEFDFLPVLSALLKKNLPTLRAIAATGDIHLSGNWQGWRNWIGSGALQTVRLDMESSSMESSAPVQVKMGNGAIEVGRFQLSGRDSQVSLELDYRPEKSLSANLNGKMDLQLFQAFVPGLEYGTGVATVGLRISGPADKYQMIGNLHLENGSFRLAGLYDEFRSTNVQLTISHDRINVDRFESVVNGGDLIATGEIQIDRMNSFIPNLRLSGHGVGLHVGDSLFGKVSGDFLISGKSAPFLFSGSCQIGEATLTSFRMPQEPSGSQASEPLFKFDITCGANEKLFVNTDTMNAEFKGNFHLVGLNTQIGLLGGAELLRGFMYFREKRFNLESGNVKFESAQEIAPRFNLSGGALVKETKTRFPVEYTVNLRVIGTPKDYKLLLSSSPALAEADIISLLILGATTRTEEGSYVDLGTALAGESPIQSKLESEFGLDINISSEKSQSVKSTIDGTGAQQVSSSDVTVPVVEVQKRITEATTLSAKRSLFETPPTTEFKLEQRLSDKFSVNGSVAEKAKGTEAQTVRSFGADVRYRFQFE